MSWNKKVFLKLWLYSSACTASGLQQRNVKRHINYVMLFSSTSNPPGYEPDKHDATALQYVAITDSRVVATARVRLSAVSAKIERVAVAANEGSPSAGGL